jgi:HEAT repeat protein
MTQASAIRWVIVLAALASVTGAAVGAAAPSATAPAASATAASTATVAAGPVTLRLRLDPGNVRLYQRVARTESQVKNSQASERRVNEVIVRGEETIVSFDPTAKTGKFVILETPSPERLLSFVLNGQERIAEVSEQARMRNLAPVLSTQSRGSRSEVAGRAEKAADPMALIELIVADLRILPEEPVTAGQTWSRQTDFGIAKVIYNSKCNGFKKAGDKGVLCADISTTAEITLSPEMAARLKFDRIESQMIVAADGTGALSFSSVVSVKETNETVESSLVRSTQDQLVQSAHLDAAATQKVAADLARIEKIIELVKADDLDPAIDGLTTFLAANPQGSWAPAVQAFLNAATERRLLTKPSPPFRMRLMLRDIRTERDRAVTQGAADRVMSIDQTLRQLATVNVKNLEADAVDLDPVVRDIAAFGLTFAPEPPAGRTLLKLASDTSAQVRGTAAVGLVIQGRAADAATLERLITDEDPRVQGAGAMLVPLSVKPDDPQAARFPPLVIKNLGSASAWTRSASIAALGAMTPPAQVPAVTATLVAAAKTDTEPRLMPTYLQALKGLTGMEASSLMPFEEWVAQHPVTEPLKVLPPLPLPVVPAVTPTGAVTPTAVVTGTAIATPTMMSIATPTNPTIAVPKSPLLTMPTAKPMLPPSKTGITMSAPMPMTPMKEPDAMHPSPTPTLPAFKVPEPIRMPLPAPSPTATATPTAGPRK